MGCDLKHQFLLISVTIPQAKDEVKHIGDPDVPLRAGARLRRLHPVQGVHRIRQGE